LLNKGCRSNNADVLADGARMLHTRVKTSAGEKTAGKRKRPLADTGGFEEETDNA
jgi:hypothetical protein